MSRVVLAVRVRPFSESELRDEKARMPVVRVEDERTVSITNTKVASSGAGDSRLRVRRYRADHCLDSSCAPHEPRYATQETVFETIGRRVLRCAGEGRSACVLAYGQSATGKTHSMLGSTSRPGLVPRLCRELAAEGAPVTVSFLEIYNEKVCDLLGEDHQLDPAPGVGSLPRDKGHHAKDLKVREHPTRGPYVQNLRRVSVRDADTLLSLVWRGAGRRRVAATRRNPASSRSHALLQLRVGSCVLHLADLAGSEKAGSVQGVVEGMYRGRQKEGANINKSLVALSNVISALVCSGAQARYVPYRDSSLTWLLKDCFSSGAATFIIATVSPSEACYGESASTLRWAARTRLLPATRPGNQITTKPQSGLHQLLAKQLDDINNALLRYHIRYIPETRELVHDRKYWTLKSETRDNVIVLNEQQNMDANFSNDKLNRYGSNESSMTSSSSDRNDNKLYPAHKSLDQVLGPVLERAASDLKVAAPNIHKNKQYRSHDVLPISRSSETNNVNVPDDQGHKEKSHILQASPQITVHAPYEVENPRAEIVASVTERLYTKKKDDGENVKSISEKKFMEPLHELKICTNARQRLVDMSQRALRARRKIGIPAHTQTRSRVVRTRDEAVDAQQDLEPYCIKYDKTHRYFKDVSTETAPTTRRLKEAAVGAGSVSFIDSFTETDAPTLCTSISISTDNLIKSDTTTQTPNISMSHGNISRCHKQFYIDDHFNCRKDITASQIININISQPSSDDDISSEDSLKIQLHDDTVQGLEYVKAKSRVSNSKLKINENHNYIDNSTLSEYIETPTTLKENEQLNNALNYRLDEQVEQVQIDTDSEAMSDTDGFEYVPNSFHNITLVKPKENQVTQYEEACVIIDNNTHTLHYPPTVGTNTNKMKLVSFELDDSSICCPASKYVEWDDQQNSTVKGVLSTAHSDKLGNYDRVRNNRKQEVAGSSSIPNINKTKVNRRGKMFDKFSYVRDSSDKCIQFENTLSSSWEHRMNNDNEFHFHDKYLSNVNKDTNINVLPRLIKKYNKSNSYFKDIEHKMEQACNSLEHSTVQYESYLRGLNDRRKHFSRMAYSGCSPKNYLQHLTEIRRSLVTAMMDNLECFIH